MIRIAGVLVVLFAAGAAVGSDYELRLYRVDIPVADDVRAILNQHLSKPLYTLVPELARVPVGLQPLAVLDQTDWDGADLAALAGVSGDQNSVPMAQGAAFYSGQEIPFEYLEPRPDGRFDRKIGYVERGIRLTLKPTEPNRTRIWITLARPGPRKPIDGVTLDVGLPTQGEGPVWTNLVMNTPIKQWSAALFAMREERESPPELLLVFLRQVNQTPEPDSNPIAEDLVAPIQFSLEAKFVRLQGGRSYEDLLIEDSNAVPVAGKGRRVTAMKLPDTEQPVPVNGLDWERLETAFGNDGPELLSAPRVTFMAGLTDREDMSDTLFKIVLSNGPDPQGRTFDKHRFGGPEFAGAGFGGGGIGGCGPAPGARKFDLTSFYNEMSPLLGEFMKSRSPGKPAVIADILTQKVKFADEDGNSSEGEREVFTGITVGARIVCTSAGEDIAIDIALVETYLDWPPVIKLTRKGSPARPNPIEYTVPDDTTLPRRVERSCWFRQPIENGETLAYLLRDDVRDDLTLVFVNVERVELDAAFFYSEPKE